jgi:hypothetical protein
LGSVGPPRERYYNHVRMKRREKGGEGETYELRNLSSFHGAGVCYGCGHGIHGVVQLSVSASRATGW